MGIFSAILDKLRHHAGSPAPQSSPQQQTQYQPSTQQQGGAAQASIQNVDIDKVLRDLAAKKGGGGNYRESIVDLLKLLDLDSSLDARKELAKELNVNAGAPGTAEQNIALHKAVMRKVAENGGKVPDSMKD
jgi:general stress protein YciG